jgi:hypothetical protein
LTQLEKEARAHATIVHWLIANSYRKGGSLRNMSRLTEKQLIYCIKTVQLTGLGVLANQP